MSPETFFFLGGIFLPWLGSLRIPASLFRDVRSARSGHCQVSGEGPGTTRQVYVNAKKAVTPGRTRATASMRLNLRDLGEGELHRGLAAEDRHQHLELLLLGVDLGDAGGQRGERA